jgi:hypothetical protein
MLKRAKSRPCLLFVLGAVPARLFLSGCNATHLALRNRSITSASWITLLVIGLSAVGAILPLFIKPDVGKFA